MSVEGYNTRQIYFTIRLCLILIAAVVQLIKADSDWQDSDQGSERLNLKASERGDSKTNADEDKNDNNDDYGDTVATRDACQGYTCNFRSSCGVAPLNPLGRTRSAMEPYVVNGEDSKYGEWPSFARLGMLFKDGRGSFCGGTIVSDRHILTAAHCVYYTKSRIAKLEVWLGDHNTGTRDHHEQVYRSRAQCVSNGYHNPLEQISSRHDWAILMLKRPIEFNDYIQPACLPYNFDSRPNYRHCHHIGVGIAGFHPNGTSFSRPVIQKLAVKQISCASAWFIGGYVDAFQACYGKVSSFGSTCFGDSGGPILCLDSRTQRWTVLGVSATVRANCDGKDWGSGFTRITTALPRIKAECRI